jgi:hypothetical protein
MYRAHKKLDVWQEAMKLTTSVYTVTEKFPKGELFGLVSQMRRAAVSVPSNIAGGSLSELDTQVEIAANLNFITSEKKGELENMMDSISKKLAGLIRHQKGKIAVKGEK